MTSSVTTTEIRDASGRRIAYCEYGDPTGQPVVVAHGSPGSRYEGLSLHNAAAAAGIRLIVPDRPGFGRTDPSLDKGFHSWDDDFVTLIDHLELDSATLMGFSGGGGYALAVAAAVPERVSKLVLACAMIPGAPRDTLRRRIKLVSALYFAATWAPRVAGAMLAGTGVFSKLRSDSVSIWPAADQAVMTNEIHRPALQLDSSEGIAQGGSAGVVDLARYRHEVPGLFQSISVPTVFPTRNRRRKRTHRSSPLGTLVDSRLSLRRDQRRRPSVRRRRPHSAHSRPRLIPLDSNGCSSILGEGIGGFNERLVVGCGVWFCGGVTRTVVAVDCCRVARCCCRSECGDSAPGSRSSGRGRRTLVAFR